MADEKAVEPKAPAEKPAGDALVNTETLREQLMRQWPEGNWETR
jgi:hypothetical protein